MAYAVFKTVNMKYMFLVPLAVSAFGASSLSSGSALADSLVITNNPIPAEVRSRIYSKPAKAPSTSPAQVTGESYFGDHNAETIVGRKVSEMRSDLFSLQGRVGELAESLSTLEQQGQAYSAEYYANVATISTQLQAGTTPGNPRLVRRVTAARDGLEKLAGNVAALNDINIQISDVASMASFLLNNARATYSLSGGIEEDHVRLAQLEDGINKLVILVERLTANVMDDVSRTTAYLNTERENLRTLSLAITSGRMFRQNLSNMVFPPANAAIVGYEAIPGMPLVQQIHPAGYMAAPAMAPAPAPIQAPSFVDNMFANMPKGFASTTPLLEAPAPTVGMGFQAPAPAMAPSMQVAPSFEPVSAPAAHFAVPSPVSPRPLVKIRFDKADVSYEQPLYHAVNQALGRFPDARFELVAVHPGTGNAATMAIESTKARRNAEKVLRTLGQMGLSLDRVDLSFSPSGLAETSEVHLYVR